MSDAIKDYNSLRQFKFERILHEDPMMHTVSLLGTFPQSGDYEPRLPAIVRIEKTAIKTDSLVDLFSGALSDAEVIERNDIYTWLFGWFTAAHERPDIKINVICPATEVHIRKYSTQKVQIVRETPALYEQVVKPYILAFPSSRTQWVTDILDGNSEADKILHRDPSPDVGYVLLPDMKWDLVTVSSLYLVAIAISRDLRSLRDLRKRHLGMLRSIRREALSIASQRWGLPRGSLRLYVHYQPSYYHFHVHIVNVNYQGLVGMAVGQAHLLDDIISLLEVDVDDGPSIFERMTLSYTLGELHGLFEPMTAVQNGLFE
ncbi:scavenger mRNA decapping enzyme [Amylocystis lapponica]|nr:scavenger mRNA decapping enzyme [Amylocystis lapponica]